jgi:hypothetical protein
MSKPFCENRRGARCFAELFRTICIETIHAVKKYSYMKNRILLVRCHHGFQFNQEKIELKL